MIDIIRHWVPSLMQSKTKYVFTAKTCPFCNPTTKSKSFRVNLKLQVFKCFQCGRGGRSIKSFIKQLKESKKFGRYSYRFNKKYRLIPNEVISGCETYNDSLLPF